MKPKHTVAVGYVSPDLDAGDGPDRWEKWRPSVALCLQPTCPIDRFHLLHEPKFTGLVATLADDIRSRAAATTVVPEVIDLADPWDFAEVYRALRDFAMRQNFQRDEVELLVHTTTGTHVIQICLFLLTRSQYLPGRLVQTYRAAPAGDVVLGRFDQVDLDVERYESLSMLFTAHRLKGTATLKSGIETRNAEFNRIIEEIELVAVQSEDPILLLGPTGSGKSVLARRIYERKREVQGLPGKFVELNCGTLRGDLVKSALFGHCKGSFTGAVRDQRGLLQEAQGGVLLLDEVGELGLDEQTMLLRALDQKSFLPLGSTEEVQSDFQLICATNRDLLSDVAGKRFREDLLARISVESFTLPPLKDRPEDIEPNLDRELEQRSLETRLRVTMSREARERFLAFAQSSQALWLGNFRDLQGSIRRMSHRSDRGLITPETVESEIRRLRQRWHDLRGVETPVALEGLLGSGAVEAMDRFELVQLADVVAVCQSSRSLSEAGRRLFAVSRRHKTSPNDAARLGKYLKRFGIGWEDLHPDLARRKRQGPARR